MSARVTLRIGRLVLKGVAPGDSAMLTAALRHELARRLAGADFADAAPGRRARVEAAAPAAEPTAAASGRALAGAIGKAVTR